MFIFLVSTEVLKEIPLDAERASHIISWVFIYKTRGKYLKSISDIQFQIDTMFWFLLQSEISFYNKLLVAQLFSGLEAFTYWKAGRQLFNKWTYA